MVYFLHIRNQSGCQIQIMVDCLCFQRSDGPNAHLYVIIFFKKK